MEFDIADPPPTNYGIFHIFFFLNEGFPYQIIISEMERFGQGQNITLTGSDLNS